MKETKSSFDYSSIPPGYYDDIAHSEKGMRSFWHNHKFQRVLDVIGEPGPVLDIGCFSGYFLSKIPKEVSADQVGVDILSEPIAFAKKKYETDYRKFICADNISKMQFLPDTHFKYVTLIEVIEHLTPIEIETVLELCNNKLKPGGKLILTTPNYCSLWPVLELLLELFSKVKYLDQHITKFNYFSLEKKIGKLLKLADVQFEIKYKTTTHFAAPFLAGLSYKAAESFSRKVKHENWKLPFGALILFVLEKK